MLWRLLKIPIKIFTLPIYAKGVEFTMHSMHVHSENYTHSREITECEAIVFPYNKGLVLTERICSQRVVPSGSKFFPLRGIPTLKRDAI